MSGVPAPDQVSVGARSRAASTSSVRRPSVAPARLSTAGDGSVAAVLCGPADVIVLQRIAGNRAATRLLSRTMCSPAAVTVAVSRQIADSDRSGPRGDCFDLLTEIIRLVNELAERFWQAQEDQHQLYKFHRRLQDSDPVNGSWDGHRGAYERRRRQLRLMLDRWDDECRPRTPHLSTAELVELIDAREYADKEFPTRPVPSMRTTEVPESDLEEEVTDALIEVGVPAAAVAAIVVLVIAAIVDPEPFSKLALILGTAVAVALLIVLNRKSDVPEGALAEAGALPALGDVSNSEGQPTPSARIA